MHYPKFKYHKTEGAKLVHSEEKEKSLGKGWFDSPAEFGLETCPGDEPDLEILAKSKKSKNEKGEE